MNYHTPFSIDDLRSKVLNYNTEDFEERVRNTHKRKFRDVIIELDVIRDLCLNVFQTAWMLRVGGPMIDDEENQQLLSEQGDNRMFPEPDDDLW